LIIGLAGNLGLGGSAFILDAVGDQGNELVPAKRPSYTTPRLQTKSKMKKRTVITTEKRELWIISGGGVVRETPIRPSSNTSTGGTEGMIPVQDNFEEALESPVKEQTVSRQ
jgi:hypothetical protein